jgi:hypothetical protein
VPGAEFGEQVVEHAGVAAAGVRVGVRGEDNTASAEAWTVRVSRSRRGTIFRSLLLLADVPDNVPESRKRWRAASHVIAGG